MSPFQPIVDKLAGIEQFLLGKKIYLAAGIFRQLYEDIVREGILLPPVVRRYWRYEGDKKLLLKWLILHKAVSKRWNEMSKHALIPPPAKALKYKRRG
jgi:hypothetical protein